MSEPGTQASDELDGAGEGAAGAPDEADLPAEVPPPPPVAGSSETPEPTVVALVFLLPPLALGGAAMGAIVATNLKWNPLGIALFVGLGVSVVGFAIVRKIFDKA